MTHSSLTEILDLDVEVLHAYHQEVIGWVATAAADRPRVVDLGAGTGAGAIALARRLPQARVLALDVSEEMLAHLRERAAQAGVADRIRTVAADLDGAWPELGPTDLMWASASLHHVGDPRAVLARAYAALRPGGVFAVTELESFPRFLADEAGAALEERCHAVLAEMRHEAGMHMYEDWGARLAEAGFAVEATRHFALALDPPLPAAAARYAHASLGRMRHGLEGRVGAGELAALEAYAASVLDSAALRVRAARTVWLARRP